MNEPPSLYYNTAEVGNIVSLRLVGVKSNTAASGRPSRSNRAQKSPRAKSAAVTASSRKAIFACTSVWVPRAGPIRF